MLEYPFFNIFIANHFETDKFKFRCVFDSDKVKVPKNVDIITHIAGLKRNQIMTDSKFFIDQGDTELKDLSLLLTITQGTHIFSENQNLGRVSNYRKDDFGLFLSSEIGDFIDQSLKNISKMKKAELDILKMALLMFYEAKHFLFYDGLRIILMMNCFEFLIGAIYRRDKKYTKDDLKLQDTYKHIITKFGYQAFIDSKLNNKIKPQTIASFSDQFRKMRNWIAHGRQIKKPIFSSSPSDLEFTFLYRLESFIRIILVDLVYNKDYARKFDVLYQLILEQNVVPMLTQEFARLKFIEK